VSDEGPVSATFDHSDPEQNFFALIGFIPGKHAVEWSSKGKEAVRALFIRDFINSSNRFISLMCSLHSHSKEKESSVRTIETTLRMRGSSKSFGIS
jgi:hypothetical protein